MARVNQSQALYDKHPCHSIGCHYIEACITFQGQCDRTGVTFKVLLIGMMENIYETYTEGVGDLINKKYLINVFSINAS